MTVNPEPSAAEHQIKEKNKEKGLQNRTWWLVVTVILIPLIAIFAPLVFKGSEKNPGSAKDSLGMAQEKKFSVNSPYSEPSDSPTQTNTQVQNVTVNTATTGLSQTPDPPIFGIQNPLINPKTTIIIIAQNKSAKRKIPLTLRYDGVEFVDAGVPHSDNETFTWSFVLKDFANKAAFLVDGEHFLECRFSDKVYQGEKKSILIETDSPDRYGVGIKDGKIAGIVTTPHQENPNEIIQASYSYKDEKGKWVEGDPLNVYQTRTKDHALEYYEFQGALDSIPEIPESDRRYTQPNFFKLVVANKTGEPLTFETSYEGLRSGIPLKFGGYQMQAVMKTLEGLSVSSIIDQKENEIHSGLKILLLVKVLPDRTVQLNVEMPQELQAINAELTFTRDGKEIQPTRKSAFQYLESHVPPGTHKWQAIGTDAQGHPLKSNVENVEVPVDTPNLVEPSRIPNFRNTPRKDLEVNEVKAMLAKKDFYDRDWNRNAIGFTNDFVLKQNGIVILDQNSGILWQQSGSPGSLTYKKALDYITKLNQEKFAGYADWRLPTLEEAMSLMEPERKEKGLYIDSMFDQRQNWIWTGDLYSGSRAWSVDFHDGDCFHFDVGYGYYVRAVRSGQSSADP